MINSQALPLNRLKKGSRGSITAIGQYPGILQRLLALGIRRGSEIEVLHHRASGVVIRSGANRVALGADIAGQLAVTISEQQPAQIHQQITE
ncbi:MAG: ferrous iron transport protein A [Gammaproteobacteria bacterium]|nr:ferrous iron transport protein A [Gammaproteobacteria bacterium]